MIVDGVVTHACLQVASHHHAMPLVTTPCHASGHYTMLCLLAASYHHALLLIAPYQLARLTGFAFVYFEDERDSEDAIRDLHGRSFGHSRRRLSVEWSRQGERGGPRHQDGLRAARNMRPTKTLFVFNFDPICTRTRDIEKRFQPYGNVLNVWIRRNFAFVQFETQEEATRALECTDMSKILDRVVSVEYALSDDGARGDSPRGGGYGRCSSSLFGRSVSPVISRGRSSPDYSQAHSPVYERYNGPSYERERSPDYGPYSRSRT